MEEREFQLLRATAFAVAVGVALLLQRLAPHAGYRGSVRTNLGLWGVNLVALGALCGACACTVARWAEDSGIGLLNLAGFPAWTGVFATVVVLDFVSYGWHRANHVVPALWRFHAAHHSDSSFTVSTGLRFHPGELLLSLPLRLVAVALLGAPPVGVVVFEAAFAFSNYVEHGDIDLPAWLERSVGRILVTPALHRFHHARAPRDREHNYGTIFVVWDRWLRTYRPSESTARIDVGLHGLSEPLDLREVLRLPLVSGPR